MNEIDSNSIDVIVTSPPYNRNKIYTDDKGNLYNDNKTEMEYMEFLHSVWSECFRVLQPYGVFFMNIGDSAKNQGFSEKIAKTVADCGFTRLQTIIWVKSLLGRGHYTPSGRNRRLNNIFEYIYVFVKDKNYRLKPRNIGIPYADKSNIGRYGDKDLRDAGNVWFIPYSRTTGSTIKKGHDAPFPIELPYRCIRVTEATSVLDPFLGTGTTLAAARIVGISGIGYEKYPRKKIIRERITEHQFTPKQVNLIPHLELTIFELLKATSLYSFRDLLSMGYFKFTKK
jgi:site-specific DNA-methyltransferase (adenine-specific)